MLQITVTLIFDPLTKKSGIIYESWPSPISRKDYLGEISLRSMSGQDYANAGRTDKRADGRRDGRTYRQTDNYVHHTVIRA